MKKKSKRNKKRNLTNDREMNKKTDPKGRTGLEPGEKADVKRKE